MDLIDRLLGFAIAMLVLSLIVEKLTNLWKLYGPDDLATAFPLRNSVAEARRAAKISAATLIVGTFIALILRADAVQLLSSTQPSQVIGWELVWMDADDFEKLALTSSDTIQAGHAPNQATFDYNKKLRFLDEGSGLTLLLRGITLLFVAGFFGLVLLIIMVRCEDEAPKWLQAKPRLKNVLATHPTKTALTLLLGTALFTWLGSLSESGESEIKSYEYTLAYASLFIGVLFSGAAVGFGSKFWHDLLDTLFQVKNLRRKLNDPVAYQAETIEGFDDYLALTEGELARQALDLHIEDLKEDEHFIAAGVGITPTGGRCVELHVSPEGQATAPQQLFVPLADGRLRAIPVHVVVSEEVTIQALQPSLPLSHSLNPKRSFGSLGCVVVKRDQPREKYVLTCYHVVKSSQHSYSNYQAIQGHQVCQDSATGTPIGRIEDAIRNTHLDAALVRLDAGASVSAAIPSLGLPRPARYIRHTEINKTKVRIHGAKSKRRNGVVSGVHCTVKIKYGHQQYWSLEKLIKITSTEPGRSFSRGGDSGSVVLDEQGHAVGMIVAGNTKVSYAIPLKNILKHFKITLATEAS